MALLIASLLACGLGVTAAQTNEVHCWVDLASSSLRLNLTGALSVELLANISTTQTTFGPPLVGNSYFTDKPWGLYLGVDSMYTAQTNAPTSTYTAGKPADGQFHRLLFTGSTVYVDWVASAGFYNSFGNAPNLWVGKDPAAFDCCGMAGRVGLASLRVWDRQITSAEVTAQRIEDTGLLTSILVDTPAWQPPANWTTTGTYNSQCFIASASPVESASPSISTSPAPSESTLPSPSQSALCMDVEKSYLLNMTNGSQVEPMCNKVMMRDFLQNRNCTLDLICNLWICFNVTEADILANCAR